MLMQWMLYIMSVRSIPTMYHSDSSIHPDFYDVLYEEEKDLQNTPVAGYGQLQSNGGELNFQSYFFKAVYLQLSIWTLSMKWQRNEAIYFQNMFAGRFSFFYKLFVKQNLTLGRLRVSSTILPFTGYIFYTLASNSNRKDRRFFNLFWILRFERFQIGYNQLYPVNGSELISNKNERYSP